MRWNMCIRNTAMISVVILLAASACGERDIGPAAADSTLPSSTAAADAKIRPPATLSNEAMQSPHSPCGSVAISLDLRFGSFENLAWASHEVVVGTVVKDLGPAWGPLISPDLDPDARDVFTDYLVSVDARVRGGERSQVIVRRLGGTIGDCTVTEETDALDFRVGDRYLLFLHERNETFEDGTPRYDALGTQGIWAVDVNGEISGGSAYLVPDRGQTFFTDIAERIVTDLKTSAPPTAAELDAHLLVPISESPVVDEPPPLPTPES